MDGGLEQNPIRQWDPLVDDDWIVKQGRGRSWLGPDLDVLAQVSTTDTCLCTVDLRAAFSNHHSYSDCFLSTRQKLLCARLCARHWVCSDDSEVALPSKWEDRHINSDDRVVG